jgi:hypothetical protein
MNDTDTNTREERMPASEVAKKFRKRTLRSGSKRGPIVRKKSQMQAIQISEARKEGHDIPRKQYRRKRANKYGRK